MKFLNIFGNKQQLTADEEELVFRLVHRLGERERMVPNEEKEEITGSEKAKNSSFNMYIKRIDNGYSLHYTINGNPDNQIQKHYDFYEKRSHYTATGSKNNPVINFYREVKYKELYAMQAAKKQEKYTRWSIGVAITGVLISVAAHL